MIINLIVKRRKGIMIIDMVIEMEEMDLKSRIEKIGEVEGRESMKEDKNELRNKVKFKKIVIGIEILKSEGEFERDKRIEDEKEIFI